MAKLIFGRTQIVVYRKTNSIRPHIKFIREKSNNIRPHIEFIKKKNQYNNNSLTGVEIGVLRGNNSYNIMKNLNIKKLYLVDPYVYYEGLDKKYPDVEDIYKEAKERLNEFGDKVVFIRKNSDEAIDDIPDNIDFVYIDGNHDYKYARKDIELYYDKLRKGGILSGHSIYAVRLKTLIRALLEFADKHDLDVDGKKDDWWLIKK